MIDEKTLAAVVGKNNVKTRPEVLELYSRDMSFVNHVKPVCVVKVRNADEVQKLVNLARETGTPLVPVSSGTPHFRGDTVPSQGGSIIVDLSGMKKVLWVNRENRVAMFEPGVTFGELIPAVTGAGLRLNMPLQPRQSKSVVGSLLEREPVTMPRYHWDSADPLAATEVIFGTGDMFRTGAAAGPGTIEQQLAAGGAVKEGAGPSSASWYRVIQGSQGTMGIVTWASARCELIPTLEEPFLIGSGRLDKILETVHWLLRLRLANECLVLNNVDLAALMAKDQAEYQQYRQKLPAWTLFFNIGVYEYYPEMRLKGQIQDMQDVLQRIGVETRPALAGISAAALFEAVRRPSEEPYWKLRRTGACEDIFFITTNRKIDALIETVTGAVKAAGLSTDNLGIYLQPVVQGVNCHCEFNLFYDPSNQEETQKIRDLSIGLIKPLMAKGAFFSRPYGEAAGIILNSDAATVAALKKVKAILDPQNILNPGKLCF